MTTSRVAGTVVTLRIEYRRPAPSQRLVGRVTRVGDRWYWVTNAGSAKEFRRINFCR